MSGIAGAWLARLHGEVHDDEVVESVGEDPLEEAHHEAGESFRPGRVVLRLGVGGGHGVDYGRAGGGGA